MRVVEMLGPSAPSNLNEREMATSAKSVHNHKKKPFRDNLITDEIAFETYFLNEENLVASRFAFFHLLLIKL